MGSAAEVSVLQLLEAELVDVEAEGLVVVADGHGELGDVLGHGRSSPILVA
jgi:hypothetical protein